MASEGHAPSSHAQFETMLQQVLKDFPHVDSFRKEQKDCIKKLFLGKDVIAILRYISQDQTLSAQKTEQM